MHDEQYKMKNEPFAAAAPAKEDHFAFCVLHFSFC